MDTEADVGSFDFDSMMEQIRSEVKARGRIGPAGNWVPLDFKTGESGQGAAIGETIAAANRAAEMRTDIPDLSSFPRPKRYPLLRLGRLIMGLLGHLRERQSRFNRAILTALDILRERTDDMDGLRSQVGRLADTQARLEHDLHTRLDDLRVLIGDLESRHDDLAFRQEPVSASRARGGGDEGFRPADADDLIVDLLDQFRGSFDDVLERQKVHLEHIERYGVGTPEMPLLDLGSGRGEWLELLKQSGLTGTGCETNRRLVGECRARGFSVIHADAVPALTRLDPESVGGITAFHLVEHLALSDLLMVVDECFRVLKPGGVLILETPNPENVLVSANTFWLDPTHRKPVPAPLLKAVTEGRGFITVDRIYLHPMQESPDSPESWIPPAIKSHFVGPRDYALISRKPPLD